MDNEDIEVFLSPGENYTDDSQLCVLPSGASMRLTAAERRWKLLKNLAVGCKRFTSLTAKEQEFLHHLNEISSTHDDTQENELLDMERQSLRDAMAISHLTETETQFLESLVKSPNITVEQLKMSYAVLNQDPLFRQESCVTSPKIVSTTMRPSDSFRSQVWTYSKSKDEEGDKKEEKKEKAPVVVEAPKKRRAPPFVYKFFARMPKTRPVSTTEEEEEMPSLPPISFSILGTSVDDLTCHPHVLSPPMMDALRPFLPHAVQQDNFWIKYSLVRDGASLRCLLSKVRTSARCLIAIETMDGQVFGAFTSTPYRINSSGYYGSGEAFVWRLKQSRFSLCDTVEDQVALESTVQVFDWKGTNRNVQCVHSPDSPLMVGGGGPDCDPTLPGGSAITIPATLDHGFSDPSVTFDSPVLCGSDGMFQIANLEVWTLTPVNHHDQAERLELGRQFVFDHGKFAQH